MELNQNESNEFDNRTKSNSQKNIIGQLNEIKLLSFVELSIVIACVADSLSRRYRLYRGFCDTSGCNAS